MHGQWSNSLVKTPLRLGQQRIMNMQVSAAEQRVAADKLRSASRAAEHDRWAALLPHINREEHDRPS